MTLSTGTEAPEVELPSGAPDEMVSLSDYRGEKNVVLLFFPMAFTGVCTDELCTVTNNLDQYEDLDAKVFGVSVNSPFTQNEWKEKEDIEIPLLSDYNREAIEAFDVVRPDLLGLERVANRSAFVIDKDGVIQYSWMSDDPAVLPNFDDIKSTLESL